MLPNISTGSPTAYIASTRVWVRLAEAHQDGSKRNLVLLKKARE